MLEVRLFNKMHCFQFVKIVGTYNVSGEDETQQEGANRQG